jgi:hypothetical protein
MRHFLLWSFPFPDDPCQLVSSQQIKIWLHYHPLSSNPFMISFPNLWLPLSYYGYIHINIHITVYIQPAESLYCCSCVYVFRADLLLLGNQLVPHPWGRPALPSSVVLTAHGFLSKGCTPWNMFFKNIFFNTFVDLDFVDSLTHRECFIDLFGWGNVRNMCCLIIHQLCERLKELEVFEPL